MDNYANPFEKKIAKEIYTQMGEDYKMKRALMPNRCPSSLAIRAKKLTIRLHIHAQLLYGMSKKY